MSRCMLSICLCTVHALVHLRSNGLHRFHSPTPARIPMSLRMRNTHKISRLCMATLPPGHHHHRMCSPEVSRPSISLLQSKIFNRPLDSLLHSRAFALTLHTNLSPPGTQSSLFGMITFLLVIDFFNNAPTVVAAVAAGHLWCIWSGPIWSVEVLPCGGCARSLARNDRRPGSLAVSVGPRPGA